jgi:NitT/TauT family transport system substrate-binding protein
VSEPGVTTLLVVAQSFLSAHPAVVADLLKAQVQANDFIKSNPAAAQADANAELASYTGKPLRRASSRRRSRRSPSPMTPTRHR